LPKAHLTFLLGVSFFGAIVAERLPFPEARRDGTNLRFSGNPRV